MWTLSTMFTQLREPQWCVKWRGSHRAILLTSCGWNLACRVAAAPAEWHPGRLTMQGTGNSLPSERLWNRVCLKLAITLRCISQVGTVTGYCGLSLVLFPAGAPQHHLWFMLVKVGSGWSVRLLLGVALTASVSGGCTASAGMSSSLRRSRVDIYIVHSLVLRKPLLLHLDVTSSPYPPCLSQLGGISTA